MPFLVSCSSEKTKHNFLQKIEKLYFDARNENNPNVIGRVLARCINKVIAHPRTSWSLLCANIGKIACFNSIMTFASSLIMNFIRLWVHWFGLGFLIKLTGHISKAFGMKVYSTFDILEKKLLNWHQVVSNQTAGSSEINH